MIGGKMDKLMNSLDFLKKEVCVFYISQLILVLEFLHSKGWVYRAASLSKIYMKENGYIAVEGVSKLMRRKTKDDELFFDICGLPYDFAPEMILCEGHNQKIDMWGLGLCAYNMLEGRHPFASYNAHETFRNILEKKVG
jgi:serine/threonine protein kinase